MNTKCIFKLYLARNLVKMGNRIVDLKPDKREGREGKTIYVFEVTEKFENDLTILLSQE